ncbi:MAG: hypothetical protein HKN74_08645 [Acidimicrobiia bacterium]|nr:hypothetical protein [Acidimicrobiia bacterium]MBT8216140.1 hypothetical protein [Acidimicrobiia bacterium]NNF10338.1 hypothetical protein [Acidimicrobiia bacterium]NNL69116.1 hypothetical protein [Acidimicrobiia bacterium]
MEGEAIVVELPLRSPYTAAGHQLTTRRGIVLRLSAGDHTGWGEFAEIPGYSRETVETALAALIGEPVIHSNPMAVAALRTAELDLEARRQSRPLTSLFGGSPGPVAAGAVIARFGDVDGTIAEAEARVADGYPSLKVKIGPGFDVEPLQALRDRFPELTIAADANGSYGPGELPPGIDELGLRYIEQPHGAATGWSELASLRARLATPICLDESITGPPSLRSAIAAGACDFVTIKPARVTGLATAADMLEYARDAGVGVIAGGLLESGIGRGAALAFARLPGVVNPADLSASDRYWARDLTEPAWQLTAGALHVPDRPGIGVDVDLGYLDSVATARHRLPA